MAILRYQLVSEFKHRLRQECVVLSFRSGVATILWASRTSGRLGNRLPVQHASFYLPLKPFRYLSARSGFGILCHQRQNPGMHSPRQPERQNIRYPLHLPVAVKLGREEMHTQSENISLNGILLSSAFLIPAGSTVELAVGVAQVPSPGILLKARGKVLRVQPKASGNFAVAIECEGPFELKRRTPNSEQET
jgi:PilZ domain